MKLGHRIFWSVLATSTALVCFQPFARTAAQQQDRSVNDRPAGLQSGEILPTGQKITPTASRGSTFQHLKPDTSTSPDLAAGHAVSTATSPDGNTLLVLTSGYNFYATPTGSIADEYVFVYDIRGSSPKKIQVLQVPNTFNGIAWNPNGKAFYVAGGADDNVHIYEQVGGAWTEATPAIPLGHAEGVGLNVGAIAAGLAVNQRGDRLVVANFYNDSLSIVDLTARAKVAEVELRPGKIDPSRSGVPGGDYPFWVAIKGDRKAYVSSPRSREIVVVDLGSDAATVAGRIPVEGQPNKMILNRRQDRLYVALDNSDTVGVIDTLNDRVIEKIGTTAPQFLLSNRKGYKGSNPNSLALSADERTLYVTNGGTNSVAVIRLGVGARSPERDGSRELLAAESSEAARAPESRVIALIPTGWYPNSVSLNKDGSRLYVVNGKSKAGPNPAYSNPEANQYVLQLMKAGLLTLPVPSGQELVKLTWQVASNNNFMPVADHRRQARVMASLREKIQHVIYVVKENRTYDQVLGDLEKGNGDPALTSLPEPITPNHHRLARRFVTLDNFYDSGGVSGDGWNWTTAARTTDFTEKAMPPSYAGRGPSYDFQGINRNINVGYPTLEQRIEAKPQTPNDPDILPGLADVAAPDGSGGQIGNGYLWDAALRAQRTVRHYGHFTDYDRYSLPTTDPAFIPPVRRPFAEGVVVSFATKRTLQAVNDPYYRGYDMKYPDFWLFKEWEREFDGYVQKRNLPALSLVALPHDHFGSFAEAIDGVDTVETQMADNDYALGLLVEKVSKSPYKDNTLIFVIEDDAQDGPDHVDAQRSIAFVVGPYVKQGPVVSTHYTTVSMVRTIADVLGIEPLGLYDGFAAPMADVFDLQQKTWTYTAVVPEVLRTTGLPLPPRTAGNSLPLTKYAAAYAKPRRTAAYWAEKTKNHNFTERDNLDTANFNRTLWTGLMGDTAAYPTVRHRRDMRHDRQRLLAAWRQSKSAPVRADVQSSR